MKKLYLLILFLVFYLNQNAQIVYGIDVSGNNGTITNSNWSSYKAAGVEFAFEKATEGKTYTSYAMSTNIANGTAAQVRMGVYHFALPEDNTAISEANYFLNNAGNYVGASFLPPSLDIEDPSLSANSINKQDLSIYYGGNMASLAQWINDWCTIVHNSKNIWPVLYVNKCYAGALYPFYLSGTINSNIKLWIADYTNPAGSPNNSTQCASSPWVGWPWLFHQFYDPGALSPPISASNVYPIGMDRNAFNGSLTDLNTLVGGTSCSQPSNDYCSTPATLIPSASCTYTQGSTCGATPPTNGLATTCSTNTQPDDDVWYQFTAASTSHTITLQPITSTFDGVIQLMSGSCPSSLNNLACANSFGVGSTETLTVTGLTIGYTYLIRIFSNGIGVANAGDYNVCVTTSSQSYTVTTSSLPSNGGTTSGGNTYSLGQLVTVNATPNLGFTFVNWTDNGNIISTIPAYSFNVNANRNLEANFSNCSYSLNTNSSGNLVANSSYNAFWIYTGSNCSWSATTSGCPWVTITNPTGRGNSLINCNLTPNTSTSPRSCVITIAGQTYTITQVGYVPPCATTPSTPNSLHTFYQSSNNIGLSWAGNITGFTNFEIERATTITGPYTHIGDAIPPTTNYFDSTGTPGTTYFYRIRACCNSNCSAYSNIDSATACVWHTDADVVTTSEDTICIGGFIVLAEQGGNLGTGDSWTWFHNGIIGTGPTLTIAPTTSGNYCVKPNGGCVNQPYAHSTCTNITVLPLPTPSTISAIGSTTMCQGSSVMLTGNNGGIWNTNATTQTINVSNIGDYYVTNVNSCGSATSNHIVLSNPSINISPSKLYVFSGDTSLLIASGASTYQWSNGGTGNAISVTPSQTTTYTVTGTLNGCKVTASITITVLNSSNCNVIANAGINTAFTVGMHIGGNPTGANGPAPYTYAWSPSTGLSSTDTSNPIINNLSSTTTYIVTVTDATGCTDTSSVTITVGGSICPNPLPAPQLSINGCVLSTAAVANVVYQWYYNGTPLPNTNSNQIFAQSGNGQYYVAITSLIDPNCIAQSTPIGINCPTGIVDPYFISNIKIYPNPTDNFINVEFDKSIDENISIEIFNSLGQMVYGLKEFNNNVKFKINSADWAAGIYSIRITQLDKSVNYKLIKK